MGQTLTEKTLSGHLVGGDLTPGKGIGTETDQVLTQDTTETVVWLQLEALDFGEAQTELAVQYCDHQTYQFDFRNTDDHRFFRSAVGTYDAYLSRPGNGIYHNIHKENSATPGRMLPSSDSHMSTPGGLDQLAIGTDGLSIVVTMGGGAYYVEMPEVVNVRLEGGLPEWSSARNAILEMFRRKIVEGGVGKIFEYTDPGVESLAVPERTTIINMGTELGVTSLLFETNEKIKDYLERQGRGDEHVELTADGDTEYVGEIAIDLSELEPLTACPPMSDNVVPVREIADEGVEQILVGSCTNGGYEDVLPAAKMVKDQGVAEHLEMTVALGSKQVGGILAREGWTAEMMAASVNVSEMTCGPCVGIGHVPTSDSVSLRTFDHNFEGYSGIGDDNVCLCSPQVIATAALKGKIVDPCDLADELGLDAPGVELPNKYDGSRTNLICAKDVIDNELIKGPNTGKIPLQDPLSSDIPGETLLKMEGNITTDHAVPATSDIPKLHSNIERLSDFTLSCIGKTFAQRAREAGSGTLVAGENYSQGSSCEHAAMCPMYLGVEAVLAQSFARIHKANLFNFGIVPLATDEEAYVKIERGNDVEIVGDVAETIESDQEGFIIRVDNNWEAMANPHTSERECHILTAGGKLPLTRQQAEGGAAPVDD